MTPKTSPANPQKTGVGRICLVILSFGAGLFPTGELIRSHLPFPPVPHVQPKVEWLFKNGDSYDTLFLGSSRTHGGIDPALFDQLMAEAGQPTHSFNLGINGMRPPEDTFVLEKALEKRRAPLKLLIVECNPFHVDTDADRGTLRLAYWHDLDRALAVQRNLLNDSDDAAKHWWSRSIKTYGKQITGMTLNLTLLAAHEVNLGRAQQLRSGYHFPEPIGTKGDRTDGFEAHDPDADRISEEQWKFLSKQLADDQKHPAKPAYISWETQKQLQRKRQMAARFGATMIGFTPPALSTPVVIANPKAGPVFATFNFNNPRAYPELFARANRLNSGHLNALGATIFTRLLVAEILESQRPKK